MKMYELFPHGKNKIIYKSGGEWKSTTTGDVADKGRVFDYNLKKIGNGNISIYMSPSPDEIIALFGLNRVLIPYFMTQKDFDPHYVEMADSNIIVTDDTKNVVRKLKGRKENYIIISTDERENQETGNIKIIPFYALLKGEKSDDDSSFLFFTSGTTSGPKLVKLSGENIRKNVEQVREIIDHYEIKPGETLYNSLPLFHAYGMTAGIFMPWKYGLNIVIGSGIKNLQKDIKETKPDVIVQVPLVYYKIKESIEKEVEKKFKSNLLGKIFYNLIKTFYPEGVYKIPFVRNEIKKKLSNPHLLISGGAPIEKDLYKFFKYLGINFMNGYGITEASPVIAIDTDGTGLHFLSGIEHKIEDGVLYIKGDNISSGYYKGEKIDWLNTGDIVEMDGKKFTIVGRKKNLLVFPNGEKIPAEKIEGMLLERGITSRVVEENGKVVAIVDELPKDPNKVKQEINEQLPFYARITEIKKGKIEMTPTGKIKRT